MLHLPRSESESTPAANSSQSTLTGDPENPTKSNDVAYAFGWGVGLFAGLLITIPTSGGHINPAITLMLASYRGFPWRKVPGYWTAQIVGAFAAASMVQGLYYQLLDQYEGGRRTMKTATLFIDVAPKWESNIGESDLRGRRSSWAHKGAKLTTQMPSSKKSLAPRCSSSALRSRHPRQTRTGRPGPRP